MAINLTTMSYLMCSAELGEVGRFIAVKRSEMLPDLTLSPFDADLHDVYMADSYVFKESRNTFTAHIWSRVPGVGWVHLQLDAEPLREFANSILSMIGAAPPASTSFN